MFTIHELSDTKAAFSIQTICDEKSHYVSIDTKSKVESITAVRIDFSCYLVAEMLAVVSKSQSESAIVSATAFNTWAANAIGHSHPGRNFHTIVDQFMKCIQIMRKSCPVADGVYESIYPLAMSFMQNWNDGNQPLLINSNSKAA